MPPAAHNFVSLPPPPREQDVRKAFLKADRDGDGFLNKADIMAFLKRHGIDATEQEVSDAILFADSNRDGKITMEEFIAAFSCGVGYPENP
jgi:Ca2+-binding EF-hand superfamily protein